MPLKGMPSLPPELAAVFKKLDRLLNDDKEQNATLPEYCRAPIAEGLDCDQLPDASGEFGLTPTNPIPTNGPLGEVLYLSRLRTKGGSPIMFHRLWSEDGTLTPVDVFEVLSLDGLVREKLFLSMYHPRKSKKVPRGYSYAPNIDTRNFTYGVTHIVENFPQKLDAHIRKWQMDVIGTPLPVGRVREAINGSPLHPSVLDDNDRTAAGSASREMKDDLLKLIQASQDPRFEGQDIAVGVDGIVRPIGAMSAEVRRAGNRPGGYRRSSEPH